MVYSELVTDEFLLDDSTVLVNSILPGYDTDPIENAWYEPVVLPETYGIVDDSIAVGLNASEILSSIKSDSNPRNLLNYIAGVMQVYFDGSVKEENAETSDWLMQKNIFDALMEAGKEAVFSDYCGFDADVGRIRELILPYEEEIIRCSGDEKAKERHLAGKRDDVLNFGFELLKETYKNGPFDAIVYVESGGFEPAMFASELLNIPVLAARYSHYFQNDAEVKIPLKMPQEELLQHIYGKRILVIEDVPVEGESIASVMDFVAQYGAREVYGMAVTCVEDMQERLKTGSKIAENIDTLSVNAPYIFKYDPSALRGILERTLAELFAVKPNESYFMPQPVEFTVGKSPYLSELSAIQDEDSAF